MSENIFYELMNKESIFIDKTKISPHYAPNKLPFRDKEIKNLSLWLAPALKKAKPHNIFIYGTVGTGKTTVTRYVLNQLQECAEQNNLPFFQIYLNCRNYQTKHAILFYCVQIFYTDKNFIGYSKSFIYDKFISYIKDKQINLVIVLDEIDKIKTKEIDDLIYTLTRCNDEINFGSVSIIGISNNVFFKSFLDPRTKSTLCEQEAVYPTYDAVQLQEILKQRIELAFKKGSVDISAINSASAIAAKHSGDARTAVMLLLKAGEYADEKQLKVITDKEVYAAKEKVEQEIVKSMVLTLPMQQKFVLLAIAELTLLPKAILKIDGQTDANVLYSGEIYDKYVSLCNKYNEKVISSRWFREYINELETYGFITTMISGKGVKGNTTLIKLGVDAKTIKDMLITDIEL